VAYLLDPSLFKTRQAVVRVVTKGIAIGQTVYSQPNATYATSEWDNKPVVQFCTSVDSDGLLDLYRKTLALAGD
jgi:inosine-uridine nucleoside N-ribohydrolase